MTTNGRQWLAHTDENRVDVLYDDRFDVPTVAVREVAALIRRGLTVREVTDIDGARRAWGQHVAESDLRAIAKPQAYSEHEGSAKAIAERLLGVGP